MDTVVEDEYEDVSVERHHALDLAARGYLVGGDGVMSIIRRVGELGLAEPVDLLLFDFNVKVLQTYRGNQDAARLVWSLMNGIPVKAYKWRVFSDYQEVMTLLFGKMFMHISGDVIDKIICEYLEKRVILMYTKHGIALHNLVCTYGRCWATTCAMNLKNDLLLQAMYYNLYKTKTRKELQA